jgi:hypothetical protein
MILQVYDDNKREQEAADLGEIAERKINSWSLTALELLWKTLRAYPLLFGRELVRRRNEHVGAFVSEKASASPVPRRGYRT